MLVIAGTGQGIKDPVERFACAVFFAYRFAGERDAKSIFRFALLWVSRTCAYEQQENPSRLTGVELEV